MCVQCKGLVGCKKDGCTRAPAGRVSVAEILAKALHANEKERFASTGTRTKTRRDLTPTSFAS